MSSQLLRLALPPALPSELLTYILTHQAHPTTLVICQPRAQFLTALLNTIDQTTPQAPLQTQDEYDESPPSPLEPVPRHGLLIPTLQQIVSSRDTKLVFIPTVTHLRAYLAAFPSLDPGELEGQVYDKPGNKVPLLVVYGLAGLHQDTSEWSAQGLGNSISTLVEAGWRTARRVVVIEERLNEDGYQDVGIHEGKEDDEVEAMKWKEACRVWEQRLPMLNGSVRRAGIDSDDGAWSGRTIEVGSIFARWFRFERGYW